jgi:hypothetical protein
LDEIRRTVDGPILSSSSGEKKSKMSIFSYSSGFIVTKEHVNKEDDDGGRVIFFST